MKFDPKALLEAAKNAGRTLWFAILAIVVVALTGLATDGAVTGAVIEVAGQQINVGFILVAIIGLIVQAIDRYRHKSRFTDSNGIAPPPLQ